MERVLTLRLEDHGARASEAGKKQQHVVAELFDRRERDVERCHFDTAVGADVETGDPAERGEVGVMLPGGVAGDVNLDMTRVSASAW